MGLSDHGIRVGSAVPGGRQMSGIESGHQVTGLQPEHRREPDQGVEGGVAEAPVDAGVVGHVQAGQVGDGFLIESQLAPPATQPETEEAGCF